MTHGWLVICIHKYVASFADAVANEGDVFARGTGAIYGSAVVCNGEEEKLAECQYDMDVTSCGHANDAGVTCTVECKLH